MIFHWGAVILDVGLALRRGVQAWFGRPVRLRDLWRLFPGDLLGWAIMHGCGIAAPSRRVEVGDVAAVMVEDRRVERWFRAQLIPVRAQTVGRYVFSREPVPNDVLVHECEHIRQWERFGPFYLIFYFGSSAVAFLRGRRPYWDNAFEVAARNRAERETTGPRDASKD